MYVLKILGKQPLSMIHLHTVYIYIVQSIVMQNEFVEFIKYQALLLELNLTPLILSTFLDDICSLTKDDSILSCIQYSLLQIKLFAQERIWIDYMVILLLREKVKAQRSLSVI